MTAGVGNEDPDCTIPVIKTGKFELFLIITDRFCPPPSPDTASWFVLAVNEALGMMGLEYPLTPPTDVKRPNVKVGVTLNV